MRVQARLVPLLSGTRRISRQALFLLKGWRILCGYLGGLFPCELEDPISSFPLQEIASSFSLGEISGDGTHLRLKEGKTLILFLRARLPGVVHPLTKFRRRKLVHEPVD